MSDEVEIIKKSIQQRADVAIERMQFFLSDRYNYIMTLEADPFNTGSIWFVKMRRDSNYLILNILTDCNRVTAEQIMRRVSMLMLVTRHSILASDTEEFEYSTADFEKMKDFESFFRSDDIMVSFEFRAEKKTYAVICSSGDQNIDFIEVGGISERGISVFSKQLGLILAGLGKRFSTDDGTFGNRYGVIDFCPTQTKTEDETTA